MIQILGIRPYTDPATGREKKTDKFFENKWRSPSIEALFKDPDKYLESVPADEKFNLYYTAANCTENKREFSTQEIIPFDIDDIFVPEDRGKYTATFNLYRDVVCHVLGVDWKDIGIVFSGHGLQFLIRLEKPFDRAEYFDERRDHYKEVCKKIDKALAKTELPGHADPSVWSISRLLRLPNTENRKDGKPIRQAYMLNNTIRPLPFDLVTISGLPFVKKDEQLSRDEMRQYPKPDSQAIMKECAFLKHGKENPNQISELQWYAALSIIGRFENATPIAHDFSQGHRNYTHQETEEKLDQAIRASGPRTCQNISTLWDGCRNCVHFEKINSPIAIKGPDFIATEFTGFRTKVKEKYVPAYEDLRRFFYKQNRYFFDYLTKKFYIWEENYYQPFANAQLHAFVQYNMIPMPSHRECQEFEHLIKRTNLIPYRTWVQDSITGFTNLQNGIFDFEKEEFKPHTPDKAFRTILPFAYDQKADCPQFKRFLVEVTGGDRELQNILIEAMGFSLSNCKYSFHKAPLLLGEGRNGKGSFIRILQHLAGPGNYTSIKLHQLSNDFNIQQLDGKLFNVADEVSLTKPMPEDTFKALTGDSDILAAEKFGTPYAFRNKCKLWILCNTLPETRDASLGYRDRLIIIPFSQQFTTEKGNVDYELEEKLKKELPGIFNLAIEGYRRLKEQKGFTQSTASKDAIENYRQTIDPLYTWYTEALKLMSLDASEEELNQHQITFQNLFGDYQLTLQKWGITQMLGYQSFCGRLKRVLGGAFEARLYRDRLEGEDKRGLRGVKFQKIDDRNY